ncbi:MAG: 50S ribosomal protein L10 [Candidatus Omnitrophota bacterium]|nr:MAG: 50S ribosomal protein L10 [Candidatus Omnitrophota bacterium]
MIAKKVGLLFRERIVEEIKTKISQSQGYLFIGFNKLKAFAFNQLRNELRKTNAIIFVSKNSLIKRALQEINVDDFNGFLKDSTGLVFIFDEDIVKVCKILVNFSKENENSMILKGGYLKEKRIEESQILELAKLPPRDILLGMAVMSLASPLTGFLNSLNQVILKFVWVVEELKKKKSS